MDTSRWHPSLKFRLILWSTGLLLLGLVITLSLWLLSARDRVEREMNASLALASAFLDSDQPAGIPRTVTPAALRTLAHVRHLHIDAGEQDANPVSGVHAPAWFRRLMTRQGTSLPAYRLLVATPHGSLSSAIVQATPNDEINEVWNDAIGFVQFAGGLFVGLSLLLFAVVRHELTPLHRLVVAMERVGAGCLDARVDDFRLPEIRAMGVRFNRMAEALETSQTRNRELSAQLLAVQEVERRSLAHELHDEFGQHLTAIRVNSAALLHQSRAGFATDCVRAIQSSNDILMRLLRGMLDRLRPDSLDVLGLEVSLQDLFDRFRTHFPRIDLRASVGELPADLPAEVQTAVYRVIQESLTNAAKHASPGQIDVHVVSAAPGGLSLTVCDNGAGAAEDAPTALGFGLAGMRYRIEALGGCFSVSAGREGHGTRVSASVPVVVRNDLGAAS